MVTMLEIIVPYFKELADPFSERHQLHWLSGCIDPTKVQLSTFRAMSR